MAAAGLRALFLSDSSLSVDSRGQLFYVDTAYGPVAAPGSEPAAVAAPPTTDPVFSLHSRLGADHTIYLDFDGHTTTGTSWNTNYNVPTIVSPAYDVSGDESTWNSTELSRMADTWEIVAEDFAPFDVDVTTEAPPVDRLVKSGGDTQWGVRVVITDDSGRTAAVAGTPISTHSTGTATPPYSSTTRAS